MPHVEPSKHSGRIDSEHQEGPKGKDKYADPPAATHLKSGVVAIIGRPNAGKSTLLNKILKTSLSIVTRKPQTTRERIHGILNEKRGQIVLTDTPGIHRARVGGLNEFMVSEAARAREAPD